jgi:hypothetical protein
MKYDKWLELREQQESLDSVEKILQSANSAIDKAFSFLINSIKKSYGNKQAMSSGMRDSLIADLRGVMQKIASLEPKVAAESTRLIDKALVIEQEVLGVQGRPVGGQQKYDPEQIMTAIRDRIKSMIRKLLISRFLVLLVKLAKMLLVSRKTYLESNKALKLFGLEEAIL